MRNPARVHPLASRVCHLFVFVLITTPFCAERSARPLSLRVFNRSDPAWLAEFGSTREPVILRGAHFVPNHAEWGSDTLPTSLVNTTVHVRTSQRLKVPYVSTSAAAVAGSGWGQILQLPFREFVEQAALLQSGPRASPEVRAMCARESLAGHVELAGEMATWEWPDLIALARRQSWGPPGQARLFACTAQAVTPAHFDEQHGLMAQVQGSKSVTLLPPDAYTAMYPFPVTHAADRSAMADVASPNLTRFPRLARVLHRMVTEELHPGDALYVPPMWWHRVEYRDHMSTSVAFWFEDVGEVHHSASPSPSNTARIRRNFEKVFSEEVGLDKFMAEARALVAHLEAGKIGAPQLQGVLALLASVGIRGAEAEIFLLETLGGRFEGDDNAFI